MILCVKQFFWLLFLFVLFSCNEDVKETKISLKTHNKVSLDSTNWIDLCVIKTYPSMKKCYLKEKYYNLYICRKFIKDTIYIFEECWNKISYKFFDRTRRYPLIIEKKFVIQSKDSAVIFVPFDFIVHKNAKYLFAKVGVIVEI